MAGSVVEGKGPITRTFSYTILPAMVTSADTNTLAVKSTLDFSFDNSGTLTTLLNGNAGGTSFDIDTSVGVVAGSTINWSIQKNPVFNVEKSSVISVAAHVTEGDPSIVPNNDNLVVGMEVTGSTLRSTRPITVESVGSQEIILSEPINASVGVPLTFTAAGITVSSITDGNTVVASQTMVGVVDDFEITFGGTESDVSSGVLDITVTKVGDNIVIAGKFQVSSFPIADTVVKLDLNKLITIS